MSSLLSFSQISKNECETYLKLSSQTLYLLDPSFEFKIFKYIPRNFKITTNNGSSDFNIEMMEDTSTIIAQYVRENPQKMQYHLNIDDNKNILSKFEQLYQGKKVVFYEKDLSITKQITSSLNISCCPDFMLLSNPFQEKTYQESQVSIGKYGLTRFLQKDTLQTFIIKTAKYEYKCNFIGIHSSQVIHSFLTENPTKAEYFYQFEDNNHEFQLICDLFNFKEIQITIQNVDSLKKIADNLEIEIIKTKIDNFIDKYDKIYYKIDQQQNSIELINGLFELLYSIKEQTVEYVKNSIIQSFWCQTEENVQELISFILQVVNTDIQLHPYLVDLIVALNNESNENNKLNKLVPFIIKRLMNSFGETTFNCSFVYKMFRKGLIQEETIISQLKCFFIRNKIGIFSTLKLNSDFNSDSDDDRDKF